jgi:hypothetical protein
MALTPEGLVKEQIKRLLRRYDVYWFMPVQNGMGSPSLDFLCCVAGRFLAIETKAPGKKPTQRQLNTIAMMQQSGAKCVVFDGDENDLSDLEAWIQNVSPRIP